MGLLAGCWQETLDAVKLASAPLYWAPRQWAVLGRGGGMPSWQCSRPRPCGASLGGPEAAPRGEMEGWAAVRKLLSFLTPSTPTAPKSWTDCASPHHGAWQPGSVFSGKQTLPPDQDAMFASRLLAVSPLGRLVGRGPSKLAWQPEHVVLAAVGTRCRTGPSSAEA